MLYEMEVTGSVNGCGVQTVSPKILLGSKNAARFRLVQLSSWATPDPFVINTGFELEFWDPVEPSVKKA